MKYIAPVASAMGISIEETAAAIGLLSNAGIQGSQSGTVLRGALSRLAKPSKEASDLMKELGFNAYDANGKMLPLNKIIGNLQKSTANLTDAQKQNALVTMFGQESLSGMLALIAAGPEQLVALTEGFENCDGSAKKMADTMQNNLKGKITAFKSALEGAGIAIGENLLPSLTGIVEKVTGVVSAFGNLDEGTQKTIVNVGLVVAAIGPLMTIGGKLISGIGTLTTILTPVGAGIALAAVAVGGLSIAFAGLQKELDANESKLENAGTYFEDFSGKVRTNRNLWTEIFGENIEIKFSDNFEETRKGIQGEIDGLLQDIQNYYTQKSNMEEAEREASLQGITSKQLEQRRILDEHLQGNLQSLSDYFMNEQGLTSQQTAEQQQLYTEFYQAQQTKFSENQNAMNEIYRTAAEENRELTAAEQAKIQVMSEENAAIMTALTTSNIDDMLSAWKAYYEANTKLVQADKEQKELYCNNVQGAYAKLTQSIHDKYAEQEKDARNNTSLFKEQQDEIINNLHMREEAETTFTSIYGNMVQEQIANGQSMADANSSAFAQICRDLQTGAINSSDFGMTNSQYMAMALESMISAGAGADDLTEAIKAIPSNKRAEVIANIQGTENAEYLKSLIDSIRSKTVTISVNQKGYANVKGSGYSSMYATGTENAMPGIASVAEYGSELIVGAGGMMLAQGRQLVNMDGGETVYNARQTNEILRNMSDRSSINSTSKIESLLYEVSIKLDRLKEIANNGLDITKAIEEIELSSDIVMDSRKVGEAVFPTINTKLAQGRYRG